MSWQDELSAGFNQALGEGREDWRKAFFEGRALEPLTDKDGKRVEGQFKDMTDAPRAETTWNTNPTIQRIGENLGSYDPYQKAARDRMGLGLASTAAGRVGQLGGTLVNDVLNDNTRAIWWLINAPQAVVNIANEELLNYVNPDLFGSEEIKDSEGRTFQRPPEPNSGNTLNRGIGNSNPNDSEAQRLLDAEILYRKPKDQARYDAARGFNDPERGLNDGLIDKDFAKPRKGIGLSRDRNYTRRIYEPGKVAMLGAPAGVAINAGLGLLNPFGGNEGYEAVFADPNDPSKSTNPILEIGAKYILGRTGNLQNWNDFKEARPDVSKADYNKYKAYKYDKGIDLNITDGDFNLGGVLKGTTDGIHGPELQFLGRTMPLLTTIIPTLGALGGTAYGVSRSRGKLGKERTAIRDGLIGGFSGLAVTSAAGMIAEEARRRAGSVSTQELTENQS